jgi:two-component system, LytTR family, response regulator
MRVMIVDDEPLARALLVRLCRTADDLHVIGEADSGAEALHAIRCHRPDLVLLDSELPDMSGFDVLRSLRGDDSPVAIVVGANAEHALRAFDAGALDYLTKPVNTDRFHEAIRRARDRCQPVTNGAAHPSLQTAGRASARAEAAGRPQLLLGERERRLYLLDPDNVDYIESHEKYARIWAGPESYISRDRLKELAVRLAPAGFVRIQRSRLVNVRAIAYIERLGHGMYSFTLTSGTCLESSPTYRAEILQAVLPADFSERQTTHN